MLNVFQQKNINHCGIIFKGSDVLGWDKYLEYNSLIMAYRFNDISHIFCYLMLKEQQWYF